MKSFFYRYSTLILLYIAARQAVPMLETKTEIPADFHAYMIVSIKQRFKIRASPLLLKPPFLRINVLLRDRASCKLGELEG